jgi:cold shock CspA family protein
MSPRRPAGANALPTAAAGRPAVGKIVRLFVGQAYGFIRLRSGLQVFFHRSDLQEVNKFNLLQIGDSVAFEVIDDPVSGARAIRVARRSSRSR